MLPSKSMHASASVPRSLEFKNVEFSYEKGSGVLVDLNLKIEVGSVVCLLGASGCGKTTLLRLAAGLDRINCGEICIDDNLVSSKNYHVRPHLRGIGLMFQEHALFPHMNVIENIAYGLAKIKRAKAHEEARRLLTLLGLGELNEHNYPQKLSGGQQQRVAMARSLAPRPGVIMMDEPFSGLHRCQRDEIRHEVISLLRISGTTVVIVTHDPLEALLIGDKIALMNNGKIVQYDDPDNLYNKPNSLFSACYFGHINQFDGKANDIWVQTPLGKVELKNKSLAHRKVSVVVRPTGIVIDENSGYDAKIVERRYLGEWDELVVDICNVSCKTILVRSYRVGVYNVGDIIKLSLNHSRVNIIPCIG